jgi:MoxR-vWA-beta-propeller ternary system domain bpX2
MAEDFANHLVQIETIHKEYLSQIRHWDNLKIATEENYIWIKNFTELQLASSELQTIPFTKTYISNNNLLFPKGSLLPIKKTPNLLWTPIERALSVELPSLNHNYFDTNQTIEIKLIASETEQKASILLVNTALASEYILKSSSIRLNPLQWMLINTENALIFGEPMLPINGKAFWQKSNFIFPVGLNVEFPLLENIIEKKLDLSNDQLIWWTSEENYCLINKTNLKPLSIASWKETLKINGYE